MEPQLHFLKERQRALIENQRNGCMGDIYAIFVVGAFLIDLVITYIQALPHGWQYTPSVSTSLFGHEVSGLAVGMAMFLLVWVIIYMQGGLINLTGWEPITVLPAWYLACCSLVIGMAILSLFPGEFSFHARTYLTAYLFFLLLCKRDVRQRERKLAQAALAAKSQVKKVQPSATKPQVKQCEICQQESQYDLCLTCEKQHRGERQRVRAQILRAKQSGVPATLTLPQWLETLKTFHYHCAYCQGPYQLMEHFIPIVEGGGTTQDNCVPGCYSCNAKKSNKHPEA